MHLSPAIPIILIFSEEKAREFYVDSRKKLQGSEAEALKPGAEKLKAGCPVEDTRLSRCRPAVD
jgi:hypothetical protein